VYRDAFGRQGSLVEGLRKGRVGMDSVLLHRAFVGIHPWLRQVPPGWKRPSVTMGQDDK